MAIIRQEINLIDAIQTASGGGIVSIDRDQYSGSRTQYFEVVGKVASGTCTVNLNRAGTLVATISVTSTSYTRQRVAFFTATTPTDCTLSMSGGTTPMIKVARIIVLQDTGSDPLTATETQIEIGAQQTGNVNTTAAPLTNPKYWYYDSAVWDGTCTFYAECTNFQTGSGVITIKLQEDNGSFASWADKVTIVNAATPSSVTRTRSAAFTPTSGRNYRIVGMVANSMDTWEIYNAKVIVQQSGHIDGATTVSGGDAVQGGTAGSGETNQVLGTSFTATSSYSTNRIDLHIAKDSAPTDNLYIELLSGSITGTVLGTSGNVAGSGLSTTPSWRTFTFGSPISLTSSTEYYIRLFRSGARDTINQYFWYATGADTVTGELYIRDNNSWSTHSNTERTFRVYSTTTGITKLEPQYLLANAAVGAGTGLQDFDTYYDPAEWSSVTNVYYHEGNNVASGTSDIKLQSDPNGTPADVTNSTITDVIERERSAAMTMPGAAATIDTNQIAT